MREIKRPWIHLITQCGTKKTLLRKQRKSYYAPENTSAIQNLMAVDPFTAVSVGTMR